MKSEMAKQKVEFGDFQTPSRLARDVCNVLVRSGVTPSVVLESTCGEGAFLKAAVEAFPGTTIRGYDCNPAYVETARRIVAGHPHATVESADFFQFDWDAELSRLAGPLLVLGNPPWVTNAAVGSLGGRNLPRKTNIDGLRGIDALTGRANFDISEWMLRENLRWLQGRLGAIAVLCKTSVARKILVHCWNGQFSIESAAIYRFDSVRDFGVSVDACLLVVRVKPGSCTRECDIFDSLGSRTPSSRFGMRDGRLISSLETYERLAFLYSDGLVAWRSGVKHDCSRVFELSKKGHTFVNRLGESLSLEAEAVFPLLKSSDVARGREPRKYVLIPHRSMDESPHLLESRAPSAWRYLTSHASVLQERGSSIYRKRPQFSIFGIGPYSFAPWKVAISGLYKKLTFSKVGPIDGQPVLFDDTCYFFPCDSEEECILLHELVTSSIATEFWSSLVFWDAKRPITAKLLNVLDLAALAKSVDHWTPTARRLAERQMTRYSDQGHQAMLFRESSPEYGGI